MTVLALIVEATPSSPATDTTVSSTNHNNNKKKDLSFFRHFGTHLSRNRRSVLSQEAADTANCNYDHPVHAEHCPPLGAFEEPQNLWDSKSAGAM